MNLSKIVSAHVWRVSVPLLEEFTTSPDFGPHAGGERFVLELRDADGLSGWGEGPWRGGPEGLEAALQRLFTLDAATLRHAHLSELWKPGQLYWQRPTPPSPYTPPVANLGHRLRHPWQVAIEMALIDWHTRRAGLPFSSFFGGAWRDRIASDYWMGRTLPEHAARCARRGKELGFRGIKLKTTLEDPNVERLEAIRDAAGVDFSVTVDPNGRFYRLDDCWKTVKAMDRIGNMSILEDAFPRTALSETRELRRRLDARVVVHIDPPESLSQVIQADCCGGLNIDSHTQGLFNWRMQAAVADQFNLPIWHGSGLDLGIYTAAQLHMASTAPNCQLPGDQAGPWLRESTLVDESFTVEDGHVLVPKGIGLGVTPNRDLIEKYVKSASSYTAD